VAAWWVMETRQRTHKAAMVMATRFSLPIIKSATKAQKDLFLNVNMLTQHYNFADSGKNETVEMQTQDVMESCC
jgi:hypothetical protein